MSQTQNGTVNGELVKISDDQISGACDFCGSQGFRHARPCTAKTPAESGSPFLL
jgi:hypothetical protein